MRPRGCSYFHFISVIRGGEVIKTPNISRVNKVPKFRSVEEIYVSIGSERDGSRENCPLKVDRSLATPFGRVEVNTKVKIEPTEEECEPDFDSMTLKQLKKTCKSKKRKPSPSVNWMDVKQEDIVSQLQEDDLDLKETLGRLKRKLLKKTKTKRAITKDVSLSFKTNSSGGRSKSIPHDQPQEENNWEICEPVMIKAEDAEFYHSQPQAITCVLPDNAGTPTTEILGADEHSGSDQVTETTLGGSESVSLSENSDEHLPCAVSSFVEAQSCGLIQALHKHLGSGLSGNYDEHVPCPVSSLVEAQSVGLPLNPLISADYSTEDVKKINNTFVTVEKSLGLPVVELRKDEGMADLMMCDAAAVQAQNCVLDRVLYEPLECVQLQNPLSSADSKIEDAIEVDGEAGSWDKSLVSPVSEQGCEEGMSVSMACVETAVQALNCVLGRVSYEHLECVQLQNPLISEDSEIEDAIEDGEADSWDESVVTPVTEQGCEEGMSVPMTYVEGAVQAQNCALSRVSYEHLECVQLQNPLISEYSKFEDAIEVDGEAGSGGESLVSPMSDYGCEEGMSDPMTCDEAPDTVFLECNKTDFQGYDLHYSCVKTPSPDPDRICENTDSTEEDKATCTIDNNNNIEAEVTEIVLGDQSSTLESTFLPSAKNMVSRSNVASVVEENESSILDVASARLTCPHDIPPRDSIDLLTGSSASESCPENVPRPPARLFSARKTISPNSQERLCRVMNSLQMEVDSDIHPCREKLSFEKDSKDKSSSSKSDIRRGRIIFTAKRHEAVSSTNTRPPMKKGKEERKGSCFRGISKGPRASHMSQHASSSSRCSSIQSCSQNAIAFSQQQMNDIERLAQKLVTEVQSMKDIFVDALQCESRTGAKLRYNIDEVRVAVENATKVEDTTRKWLSMMTRDCNRFGKIMRLAEADGGSGSPEKAATHIKGRKMMFADEAGGSLCHVRVFEPSEVGVACPVKPEIGEEAFGA